MLQFLGQTIFELISLFELPIPRGNVVDGFLNISNHLIYFKGLIMAYSVDSVKN